MKKRKSPKSLILQAFRAFFTYSHSFSGVSLVLYQPHNAQKPQQFHWFFSALFDLFELVLQESLQQMPRNNGIWLLSTRHETRIAITTSMS